MGRIHDLCSSGVKVQGKKEKLHNLYGSKKSLRFASVSIETWPKKMGKDPKGLAATALYIAAKPTSERQTQAEIADAARITEVTLRT